MLRYLVLRFLFPFVLAPFLAGCAMDREDVLEKKYCDPDGTCALGYRCRDGTCVPDDRERKRALPLTSTADGGADAGPARDAQ